MECKEIGLTYGLNKDLIDLIKEEQKFKEFKSELYNRQKVYLNDYILDNRS